MDILLDDSQVLEIEGEERGEDVVVITAQIHDLGVAFLQFLEHDAHEARVRLRPVAGTGQLPAVDDVAIEDQSFAARVTKKVIHLVDLAVGGAEVDIRENHRADLEERFHE